MSERVLKGRIVDEWGRKGEEEKRKERREGRSMGHGLGWKGEEGRCIMDGDRRGRKEDPPWMGMEGGGRKIYHGWKRRKRKEDPSWMGRKEDPWKR